MMKTFVIFVAVISVCSSQDFSSWCPNLDSDLTECMNVLDSEPGLGNLFTDISKVLSLQTLMSDMMSVICQETTLTAMKNFYGCIYGKIFTCIPGEWKKAFPDVEKAKGALTYMCQNVHDIDVTCMASSSRAMTLDNCMLQGTSNAPDVTTVDGFLAYICSVFLKYSTCTETAYGTCPKKTAEIMTKINEFGKRMGCYACMSRPSLSLLATILILLFAKGKII